MNLLNKMIRAASLDFLLYVEVENDPGATREALLVVLIAGLSNGIGVMGVLGTEGILGGFVTEIVGWVIWSVSIFLIGLGVFGRKVDMEEIFRCLGFAYSAGALSVLGLIPYGIGLYIRIIIIPLWIALSLIVATRQAFEFETSRAIFVVILAAIPFWLFKLLLPFIL